MSSSNDGGFVGTMKSIILILFMIGIFIVLGRELFTKDYVKVAQKSQIEEAYQTKGLDITYGEAFKKIFEDGEWEQKKKGKYDSYPPVIYTGKYKDSAGTHSVKYAFEFSNELEGFSTCISDFEMDGKEYSFIEGVVLILQELTN